MNAKKKQLSRENQVGLFMLVIAMVLSVAVGGVIGLTAVFCGVGGFYILTHKDSLAWLSGRKA